MDIRLEQIKDWLEKELGLAIDKIEPASNDASFRRYFRVNFQGQPLKPTKIKNDLSYIVMDAPPTQEDIQPFISVTELLASLNLNVPTIYEQNLTLGFLLLTDLGNTPYLEKLNDSNANDLYKEAMSSLLHLKIDKQKVISLQAYDDDLMTIEMNLFEEWFVNIHLDYKLTKQESNSLAEAKKILLACINEQDKVIVHRDFHSRNLMITPQNNPGVIDYQDAVIGPCTYDLVSLLRDSYIEWPEEQVADWLSWYQEKLLECGITDESNPQTFTRWFDFMGMQRQIKVVGIFARLYHRDGKENYLKDIPLTYKNLLLSSQKYPELDSLTELLKKLLIQYENLA